MEKTSVNWELCVICQQKTQEKLQCPANSKRKDYGIGYISFLENVRAFQDINCMPFELSISLLESGIEAKNKASWHKSCRDLFSNTKN